MDATHSSPYNTLIIYVIKASLLLLFALIAGCDSGPALTPETPDTPRYDPPIEMEGEILFSVRFDAGADYRMYQAEFPDIQPVPAENLGFDAHQPHIGRLTGSIYHRDTGILHTRFIRRYDPGVDSTDIIYLQANPVAGIFETDEDGSFFYLTSYAGNQYYPNAIHYYSAQDKQSTFLSDGFHPLVFRRTGDTFASISLNRSPIELLEIDLNGSIVSSRNLTSELDLAPSAKVLSADWSDSKGLIFDAVDIDSGYAVIATLEPGMQKGSIVYESGSRYSAILPQWGPMGSILFVRVDNQLPDFGGGNLELLSLEDMTTEVILFFGQIPGSEGIDSFEYLRSSD